MNLKKEICNAFNKHAATYEKAAKIQYEIGMRLLNRLSYINISPNYVLDLGCGPGIFTRFLQKKYPRAKVIGIDIAHIMLQRAKKKQTWWGNKSFITADMTSLPFQDGLFDLVFTNQVVHWSPSIPQVIKELNRVMSEQGCLMLSTLGLDTFKEINQAWSDVDCHSHSNHFPDMHDIGDYLLAERFLDPIVDMEILVGHYSSLDELLLNLKAQGVRNINSVRNQGLTGKNAWRDFVVAYQNQRTSTGKYPLTYEVIYAHGWRGSNVPLNKSNEFFFPVEGLRQ